MKHLKFIAALFLFIAWPASAGAEDSLQSSYSFQIMSDVAPYGLVSIYTHSKDSSFKAVKNLYLQIELQIHSLRTDTQEDKDTLQKLLDAQLPEPEFLAEYQAAIDWAEKEKQKSAEELYELAHNAGALYPASVGHLTKGLRREYLRLSAQKGHQGALNEYKAYQERLEKFISAKEKQMKAGQ